jgi:hypothetical protein
MSGHAVGAHNDLHSAQGARKGEHRGRSPDPIIKVHDIAWLEFEKPDLTRTEAFSQAFGFSTAHRTADELYLRGTDSGSPCVLIRRGPGRGLSAPHMPHRTNPMCGGWPRRRVPECARCPSRSAVWRSTWQPGRRPRR